MKVKNVEIEIRSSTLKYSISTFNNSIFTLSLILHFPHIQILHYRIAHKNNTLESNLSFNRYCASSFNANFIFSGN